MERVSQNGTAQSSLKPFYVGPLHDYAFLHYSMQELHNVTLKEMAKTKIKSKNVEVGLKIWVLGKDPARRMSILPPVVSRVDRNLPGSGYGYNDARKRFSDKLSQASTDTFGGSSSNPIVKKNRFAVGLVAGGAYQPCDRRLRTSGQNIGRETPLSESC